MFTVLHQVPQFCAAHKDNATMVDVVNPMCTADGCNLAASFGMKGSKVSAK
jgi:hypothetical protein